MNMFQSIVAATVVVAAVAGVLRAEAVAEWPPADAKPIVEIVEQLEAQGYGPFVEISFDDGHWDVEVCKENLQYELAVDARTGKVFAEHRDDADPRPPKDALKLSRILRKLSNSGYANFKDVSFERRAWEIECVRKDTKREIHVDPATGQVISDRLDD